jgi:hypothetical protein
VRCVPTGVKGAYLLFSMLGGYKYY